MNDRTFPIDTCPHKPIPCANEDCAHSEYSEGCAKVLEHWACWDCYQKTLDIFRPMRIQDRKRGAKPSETFLRAFAALGRHEPIEPIEECTL